MENDLASWVCALVSVRDSWVTCRRYVTSHKCAEALYSTGAGWSDMKRSTVWPLMPLYTYNASYVTI
jgi:hypothetical protein